MYPEEAVQAAIDSKVKNAIPVHWAAFSLALHHWKEPVERFVSSAGQKQLAFLTPKPGAIIDMSMNSNDYWWESFE